MYKTTMPEAIKIIEHLWEDLKQHYWDDRARRGEYLPSKAKLKSDAGDEEKANTIKNIKKIERRKQFYRNFKFH